MLKPERLNSWQAVRAEVLRRIRSRDWAPGDQIPNEAALAAEFGCARATVNRALRSLAEAGLLDRRRKAGSRVALHPVGRAVIEIPVIREEVETRGGAYGYALAKRDLAPAPPGVRDVMGVKAEPLLHVVAVHLSDGAPYVVEDRWVAVGAAPGVLDVDLEAGSANEWLLANVPYTHGELAITAAAAPPQDARLLRMAAGAPLLVVTRTTWNGDDAVTAVRLSYPPGHRISSRL